MTHSAVPSTQAPLGTRLEPWLLGAFLFAVYAAGACRTVYVGDSGELTTAVAVLGIPHPSGYPLYVMLGKLWTVLVPVGSVAFRMSLFSAACTAAACGVLFALCRRVGLARGAAYTAALLLAFAPSVWSQANIQRVYALNTLFVVASTSVLWSWSRTGSHRTLLWAYFLFGLGACNHTFMLIYGLAASAFVVCHRPTVLTRPARILAYGGMTALGLLPYLYLPLRSRFNPRLDWGNPETLDAFLAAVLRRDFWERAWIETPADLLTIGADYLHALGTETAWGGAALALLGVAAARKHRWPVLLPLLIMAGNFASMALHGSRSDLFIWHRYYAPSFAMTALLSGLGAQALSERVPRAAQAALLALPLLLFAQGYRSYDRSRYEIAEAFSQGVLDSLPPGADLIATDDNVLFVLMYLHLAEGRRPDVNLVLQGVGGAELPPLRFNPDTDPVFFTHHPNWNLPELEIVPLGLVFQARRRGAPPPAVHLPFEELPGESDPNIPKDYLTQNLIGLFHYMVGFTFESTDWPRAHREMQRAALAAPGNDVLFYNLGLIYWRNGQFDRALDAFRRSHSINPRHLASVKKPRASDKVDELEPLVARVEAVRRTFTEKFAEDGPAPASPAYHLALADALDERGEELAARGQRLYAAERAVEATGQP